MLTVILIDDEEEILQGLSRIVDWQSIGCQIVHMSTDPIEAVEKVAELQPNVVLTDIKMPQLSGLELIAQIQHSSPATKTIVISGYSDFELVKKALQLGVFNYLLKPVDENELLESLLQIRTLFLEEKPSPKDKTISSAVLLRLLANSASVMLPNSLLCNPCLLFASTVGSGATVSMEELAGTLQKWLSRYGQVAFAEKNGVLFLLVFGLMPEFSVLQTEYQRLLETQNNAVFSACSVPIHKIESLAEWSHALANQLLSNRFFERTKHLHQLPSPVVEQSKYASAWVNGSKPEVFRKIRSMVANMKFHEIPSLFAKMERTLASPELNANPFEVRMAYRDVLGYLKITASDLNSICFSEKAINEALMAIESASTIMQISQLVVEAAKSAVRDMPPLVNAGKVDVNHIRMYLHLHLAEDLSLSRVASLFFLSTSYLSTIFAKEIGQPFSSYVLSLRLEKAAELLTQTKMSIGDICSAVGFSSEKTFFKQFRSHYHCTPTQFRKYNCS